MANNFEQEIIMADRFYGVDKGQSKATVDTSTTGLDIELIVDDAVGVTKKDIVIALERIKEAVLQDGGFNSI
jgi:hypothetical protein